MNQWSRRRKRTILSLVFFVLAVLVGIPLFFLFYHPPTCNDSKQNGNETGVDCGGSCQLLCTALSLPLILKGDPRVLALGDGTFEVVALIQNPNSNGEVYRAGYTFKLYDATSSIPVRTVEGETYVPRGVVLAIFEGPFKFPEGVVPKRATLKWKEESLIWQKNTQEAVKPTVKDLRLSRAETSPRLDASVENVSLENVSNVDLVALISDETGSIFAASKTFIDSLPAGSKAPIVFTWPKPFTEKALDINIIVRIFPDRSFSR